MDSALLDDALAANDRAATLVNRGIINMQARKIDAALADYDAAIKLAPDTADACINKGIALVHIGNRDAEAVAVLTEALARSPTRPAVVYYHACQSPMRGWGGCARPMMTIADAAQLAPEWEEPAEPVAALQVRAAQDDDAAENGPCRGRRRRLRIRALFGSEPGFGDCGGQRFADRHLARLLVLGDFAHQLDIEQAIGIAGAGNLDGVGKLEATFEGALGDAAMQEDAGFAGIGIVGGERR